ncbi:MAG TPA: AAA family ATPase [Kouleothrix sp.]|uniref:AAA family ATPase n=1 Tax=Kouleothrix sp. TaxID=2779161 RepID=UPI002BB8E79E|nr:AAA family ATPase [Kouleothrix sp.]
MKLERIALTNFRQYFGEQLVRFSQDAERNVTVFHGVNGAGKTSLFAALNWCLYGEGVEGIGQIISKEAVLRAEVGEEVRTKVVVTFIHEGQRYVASRQLKGMKQPDGSVREKPDIEFLLMRTRYDGQSVRVDNAIGTMNAILPANVRTYFLFDGEKIETFARPESADEVRYAVYGVLNLKVLENARDHLGKVARDLRTELRSLASGELKALVAKDVELRQQETDLAARQDNLKKEIAAAKKHDEEVNQQLRNLDAVQALQKQYDLYTAQMQERDLDFKGLVNRIRDQASQGYIALIGNAIAKAQAILDEKRQRGEIPSNIRQQFVQDLLDRKMCICGRSFAEHDEAHIHLLKLLGSAVPSSLENNVLTTSGILRSLPERGADIVRVLNDAMVEKVRLEQTMDRLYAERDDIKQQMDDSDHSEASMLSKKRAEFKADMDKYQEEDIRVGMQLEDLRKKIVELEKQISLARKSEVREQLLSHKIELAQHSSEIIDTVYKSFAEEKRQQIEQRAREIFQSLAWKGGHFSEVRLSKEYQLDVIDRYGLPARSDLSAGERQVLSLSFIAAMAGVAEREAPLVMDTPFGRLSSAHRESITARIPELATQLVLFVTDEELRDQALENLRPRIGAEYVLHFDPNTSCTIIEELRR